MKAAQGEARIAAMQSGPRCGAKTRAETPCKAPVVTGKKRCRMHGGAAGSGAPKGNRNAFKTGLHAKEEKERRRYIRELMRQSRKLLAELE